jgi:hypothetical protein
LRLQHCITLSSNKTNDDDYSVRSLMSVNLLRTPQNVGSGVPACATSRTGFSPFEKRDFH